MAMEVPVRLPKGFVLIKLSASHTTIAQLKQDLADQEGIPVAQQRLVRLGQLLPDDHEIDEAQVNNAPVIQCFDLGARSIAPSVASSSSEARRPVMIKFRIDLREDDTTRSITINLASRDLIYHIKARAKDVFKIRVASQVLLLEGEALHNGRRLQHYLRHHKFSFEQTNILTLRNDGPPLIGKSDFVQIFVRTLTGKTITINDVDLGGRVWLIKEAVQQKEGVPPSSQRLIFSGKQLQDDILVSSYGIVAGSSLHLVLRLKGGLRSQLSLYTLAGLPVEGIT